jgi:hypothetical protein
MTLFYLLMLTIVALVVYAGYDETLRLVRFLDLSFKYAMIRVRMKWMERKLRRRLLIDRDEFKKSLQEYKKHGD